jgi:uncharacterized repeat protein (TIGR03803 family)
MRRVFGAETGAGREFARQRKRNSVIRYASIAAWLALSAILLAGCSSTSSGAPPIPAGLPNVDAAAAHGTFELLHAFGGPPDGAYPEYGLVALNGKLYGATCGGGTSNLGTVYEVTASGTERTIYSFKGGLDGACAYTGLIVVNGNFYGTTTGGGNETCSVNGYQPGCGTVFEVTPAGTERVVYRFTGGANGSTPQQSLISMNGLLYGAAAFDGNCATCGTVFEVSTSGKERTLYRFKGGSDGAEPLASLIALNGVLYGTTATGGTHNFGTVYAVTTAGKEHLVYQFQGGLDGADPWANLVTRDGVLYGTTIFGGGTGCSRGCGIVFSLTTAGKETVLHRFGNGDLGGRPLAALTDVAGTLYGSTTVGAKPDCKTGLGSGCGSLFKIASSGTFKIVHEFRGPDGAVPQGALLPYGRSLYGTAFQGGSKNVGTIFKFTP